MPGGKKFVSKAPDPAYPHDIQLPDESDEAFEAWVKFRDAGPSRMMTKVAAELDRFPQVLSAWAKKYHWHERLGHYKRELEIELLNQNSEQVMLFQKDMIEVQLQIINRLKDLVPKLSFPDMSLADAAVVYERLAKVSRLLASTGGPNGGGPAKGNVDISQLTTDQLQRMFSIMNEGKEIIDVTPTQSEQVEFPKALLED